jgi:D-alanyl-D-alanine carboxypeptidase/D-alanyl-D-alanine-endopeptidase (penicillin-binding protein 4)
MRVLLIALLLTSTLAHAGLKERLEKVLHASGVPRSELGLVVMDVNHVPATQVFAVNEQQEFIPASVTKLATAVAALERLGPSYKFQTGLWSAGSVNAGVLHGDLVLKGGGDAGFVSETLWFLVNEFSRTGITKIDGNIVVDDGDFDGIRADPSRDPERVDRAYDAPVGAMSFNWNSINIFVRPTAAGQPPEVHLDPLADYFEIDNKAKTVNGAGLGLEISRVGHKVIVRGTIGEAHDEFVAFKNIDDPADWSGRNLKFFLSQRGISVSGSVKSGVRPEGAHLLAKADSKPISQAVADMMKFSNNYVAEMLTKGMALSAKGPKASLDQGMGLINQTLVDSVGLDSSRFTLLNPSGLSRHNRMRPRDLVEILLHAQRSFPTFAEFLSALPLAGLDGTLKKRMQNPKVQGWVRAKTGSLAGIVALAGFAGQKDGQLRAFAFIFNGKSSQDDSARHLFDGLAAELVQ